MRKIVALALLFSFNMKAQNHEKACDIFSRINNVLQSRHIQPKPVDDSLSVYVFNTVINNLDKNHTLFLQEDYDKLAVHKNKLDDYLKNKDCSFFEDFIVTYKMALLRKKKIVKDIIASPLPYTTNDTIFYSKKAFPYKTKIETNKKYFWKRIIYDILEDVAKLSKNKDSLKLHLNKLGKLSKDKIGESYLCKIDNYLNPTEGLDNSIYNRFFSTFCSYFDPHSTYFNYNEKASFVSGISSKNYSLGIYVSQNEKGEIIIEEIIPGGPAYKTNRITKGDQILKLTANDLEYTVSCASITSITNIVFSDTYRTVDLTLRKKNGVVYSIKLDKKIMKSDNHSVYSYILGDTIPIGYIKVPSFYSSFNNTKNKGCAADVAKEVIKLKKQDVKGIIIDLQDNSGGSMDEVISMVGMFINFGPISIIAGKNGNKNIIKDYNRGMLYNGPLLVLTNGYSASASEFFSGAMQEHNRAIIIGTTTMGKASMQTILPLYKNDDNKDFVKVTINKFYQITGKSSQYSGIVPHITLPVFFDKQLPRESTLPNALKNDTLSNGLNFKPVPDPILKNLIANSKKRIASDSLFNKTKSINSRIDKLYTNDKPPLVVTFDSVFDDVHIIDNLWNEIITVLNKKNNFKVTASSSVKRNTLTDEFYKSMNEYKIRLLKTDPFIYEGIKILNDFITMEKH
ncbi:MAG: hypothetical protein BM557_01530 [Flavobacterium sp. MedPE-SWcel]|uniref:S41 family peptidase n=1 Tax=uncultured Flavobacterium sp. TaxID=165435 RepID=UPI00091B22C8|nr:S41 family peptidase [uncultured Flavobacterium sp.]OIQ22086.1 MAG: hypothetical protein BM557_01530 [Flavobacterium sp. MedPE-SWcel]